MDDREKLMLGKRIGPCLAKPKNEIIDASEQLRPIWTTTVSPDEYDARAQFENAVKNANDGRSCFVEIDIGKVWGLFLAWESLAKGKG